MSCLKGYLMKIARNAPAIALRYTTINHNRLATSAAENKSFYSTKPQMKGSKGKPNRSVKALMIAVNVLL
jgi:hypothetical protein